MKQDKEQTQVLLWTATAALFLFVTFRLKIMEDIGHSLYIPLLATVLLLVQLISHEQATISLRKKSPNFTNYFYSENGRMILGNMIASALVLEFNIFNYEHSHLNYSLELIGIPFLLIVIFLVENSQGGFLDFRRIYFPKKWDQIFKAYGVDILSISLMIALWIPVIFKIPMSALLWIFLSTLLLKASVIYTNKYNHMGWCFLLEILLTIQLLTLGLQSSQIWLLVLGILAGILFLMIYMPKMSYEKGNIAFAIVLFTGSISGLYYVYHGRNSIVFYLQREIALLTGILLFGKVCSFFYRRLIKKEKISKYSYAGVEVGRISRGEIIKERISSGESVAIHQCKALMSREVESTTETGKIKAKKQKQIEQQTVKNDKNKKEKVNILPIKKNKVLKELSLKKEEAEQKTNIEKLRFKKEIISKPKKMTNKSKQVSVNKEKKKSSVQNKQKKKLFAQSVQKQNTKKLEKVENKKQVTNQPNKKRILKPHVTKPLGEKSQFSKTKLIRSKSPLVQITKKAEVKKTEIKKPILKKNKVKFLIPPKNNWENQEKVVAKSDVKVTAKKKMNYFRKKKTKKLVK